MSIIRLTECPSRSLLIKKEEQAKRAMTEGSSVVAEGSSAAAEAAYIVDIAERQIGVVGPAIR